MDRSTLSWWKPVTSFHVEPPSVEAKSPAPASESEEPLASPVPA
jgi:hypothetical protein